MAEPSTLYKLMILYMLEQVETPLSNTMISDFFLDMDYTSYFSVQQALHDLQNAELIVAVSTYNNTHYRTTPAGRETLAFFDDKITDGARQDVAEFCAKNNLAIRKEAEITADYYRTPNQNYAVRCQLKRKNLPVIDLTLHVKTKQMAEAICLNWESQSGEVYRLLMDLLIK